MRLNSTLAVLPDFILCRSHQASGGSALRLHSLPDPQDSPLPSCRTCKACSNQPSRAVTPARGPQLQICRICPAVRALMLSCRHSNSDAGHHTRPMRHRHQELCRCSQSRRIQAGRSPQKPCNQDCLYQPHQPSSVNQYLASSKCQGSLYQAETLRSLNSQCMLIS